MIWVISVCQDDEREQQVAEAARMAAMETRELLGDAVGGAAAALEMGAAGAGAGAGLGSGYDDDDDDDEQW